MALLSRTMKKNARTWVILQKELGIEQKMMGNYTKESW